MSGLKKTYYEELEVTSHASADDIRISYKKLALRFHPDRNPQSIEECQERFKRISQAYKVLSDPQQRNLYDLNPASFHGDQSRHASQRTYCDFPMNGFHFGYADPHFAHFTRNPSNLFFQSMRFDESDIFDVLFSGELHRPRYRAPPSSTGKKDSHGEIIRQAFSTILFLVFSSGWAASILYANIHVLFVVATVVFITYALKKKLTGT